MYQLQTAKGKNQISLSSVSPGERKLCGVEAVPSVHKSPDLIPKILKGVVGLVLKIYEQSKIFSVAEMQYWNKFTFP